MKDTKLDLIFQTKKRCLKKISIKEKNCKDFNHVNCILIRWKPINIKLSRSSLLDKNLSMKEFLKRTIPKGFFHQEYIIKNSDPISSFQ